MLIHIPDQWFEDILGRPLTEAERRKMIDDPKFSQDFYNEVLRGTSRNSDLTWFLLEEWGFVDKSKTNQE